MSLIIKHFLLKLRDYSIIFSDVQKFFDQQNAESSLFCGTITVGLSFILDFRTCILSLLNSIT